MAEAPIGQTPGAQSPPSSPAPTSDRAPARVPEGPRSADVVTAAPAGGTRGASPAGPSGDAPSGVGPESGAAGAGAGAGAANRRRRGSRGGRGRSRTGGQGGAEGAGASDSPSARTAPPASSDTGAAPDRTPPGGGATADATIHPAPRAEAPAPGAGAAGTPVPSGTAAPAAPGERPRIGDSRPSIGDTRPASPGSSAAPAEAPDPVRSGGGRNRNRGSRSGGGGGGSAAGAAQAASAATSRPAPSATRVDGGARADGATKGEGRRGGRERRGKAVGRYQICVHVRPEMTQIALLEGRTLVEHYISRASDDATQIDGNIYRGRVQNVLPGMEAAFIDIGTPKNAVLYHGDVRYDTDDVESSGKGGGQPRIEQLLKPGQTILCQVTKNPIGAKGARLTQEVSLPGRFVVLVPNSTAYGISKRLEDAERKRLRRIVDAVRPDGHGLIVRTAAAGASAEELEHDVGRLVEQWDGIAAASLKGQGAALLYREPAIAVRVIREELNREYRGVVIDDPALYQQVRDYVGAVNPELADRVEYYDPEAEALPIFERFHVHEQLHKALDRKVFLPSGGSLVIDRTEALTVIDVNTGKNVGTTNLEETVYRNNLEAADEVARQLRLRDIGGIIVIDFIDMEIRENRDKVGAALRTALARDKTRTQVFDISELGLVEMTRKRVSEGLIESMSTTCEVCEGRGIVFDDPDL